MTALHPFRTCASLSLFILFFHSSLAVFRAEAVQSSLLDTANLRCVSRLEASKEWVYDITLWNQTSFLFLISANSQRTCVQSKTDSASTACACRSLYIVPEIFFAVFFHGDLHLALGALTVGVTVCGFFWTAVGGCGCSNRNFDARGDRWSALLVSFGAAVAGDASHTIFAWTLSSRLVTGLTSGTNRMTITGCSPGLLLLCSGNC